MGDTTLRELVYGKGAHVDPIACVEDISADVAASTVDGCPHSIWQIVEHMNYWMEYDLGKIGGENTAYPEQAIESWPAHPEPASEEQWHAVRHRLEHRLSRLAELANSDDEEMERTVSNLGFAHAPRSSNVYRMLWQLAIHNSYHVGQIALLRRQLGKWPPRRGGDTW